MCPRIVVVQPTTGHHIHVDFDAGGGRFVGLEDLEFRLPKALAYAFPMALVRQFLVRRQPKDTIYCTGSCLANACGIESVVSHGLSLTALNVVAYAPYAGIEELYERALRSVGETGGFNQVEELKLTHMLLTPESYCLLAPKRTRPQIRVWSLNKRFRPGDDPSVVTDLTDVTTLASHYVRSRQNVIIHFHLNSVVKKHAVLLSLVKRNGKCPQLIYIDSANIPMTASDRRAKIAGYIKAAHDIFIAPMRDEVQEAAQQKSTATLLPVGGDGRESTFPARLAAPFDTALRAQVCDGTSRAPR